MIVNKIVDGSIGKFAVWLITSVSFHCYLTFASYVQLEKLVAFLNTLNGTQDFMVRNLWAPYKFVLDLGHDIYYSVILENGIQEIIIALISSGSRKSIFLEALECMSAMVLEGFKCTCSNCMGIGL